MTLLLLALLLQPAPEDSVFKLFDQVAHPYLKYQDLKEPSKETLVEMGAEAARILVSKMRTRNAREHHALVDILSEIGEGAIPYLIETLKDTCGRAQRLAVHILGKIGSEEPVSEILEFLDDTLWKNRSAAVEALGGIAEPSTLEAIVGARDDPVEIVRKEVAHALSFFHGEEARATLFHFLDDPFYSVRYTAFTSLMEFEELPLPRVLDALKGSSGFKRALCLRLLLRHNSRPLSKSILMAELKSPDWRIRAEVSAILKDFELSFSDRQEIAFLREREGSALVFLGLSALLGEP
jgi:HEAT repeat protein